MPDDISPKQLTVRQFYEDEHDELRLTLLTDPLHLDQIVAQKDLHRPGLALAGFLELFTHERIQVLGNTEFSYLRSLSPDQRRLAFERVFRFSIPCIVITNSNPPADPLLELADRAGVAVFQSELSTTELYHLLSDYLDDFYAPSESQHATLVDVYGTGLLLTGKSGIGKSEVALDLVERGHRLVADDAVIVTRKADRILMGAGNDLLQHMMEIRGLGIIDVRQIYGISSVRMQKRVEMVVELCLWEERGSIDRTGLEKETVTILGLELPLVRLPIFPGKNITVICETLALNHHLKVYGYDSSQELNRRLLKTMEDRRRLKAYLRRDEE
jgi:HPr kinase/phosphorylase